MEICFSGLERTFGLIKLTAFTYGFYVNHLLGRPRGWIKDLWA